MSKVYTPSEWIIRVLLYAILLVPLVFIPDLFDIYDLAKATYVRLLVLIGIAVWILHISLRGRIDVPRTPLFWPLVALLVISILAAAFSVNPILATIGGLKRHEGWTTFLMYIVILFAASTFFRRKDLPRIATVFASVTVLISIYGIAQRYGYDFMSFGNAPNYDLTRAFSTTGNPVFLGTYLAVAVPFFAVLALTLKTQLWRRVLFAAAASLGFGAAIFTYSRGAWFGLAVAAPLMLILIGAKPLLRAWKPLLGMVVLAVAVTGSVVLFNPDSSQFSSSVVERATASLDTSQGSTGTRLEMWKGTLGMVAQRPVLGSGLETFKGLFPEHRSLQLIKLEGEYAIPDRPHNEALYIVSSLGLVGLTAVLWALIAFFWFAIKWMRAAAGRDPDSPVRWGLAAILVAVTSSLVAEATSFTTMNTTPTVFFLMGFAAALGVPAAKIRRKQLPKIPAPIQYASFALLIVGVILVAQFIARIPLADYNFNQARFARAFGDLEKATRTAESAVRLNPYQNMYRIELGAIYTDIRTRTQDVTWRTRAAGVYRDAVEFDEHDEDSWANLGNSYLDLAQSGYDSYLVRAEAAFKRAIVIDPWFSVAHSQLGSIYFATDRYELAIPHFEIAAVVLEGDDALLRSQRLDVLELLAQSQSGAGLKEEALATYLEAQKLDEEDEGIQSAIDRITQELSF